MLGVALIIVLLVVSCTTNGTSDTRSPEAGVDGGGQATLPPEAGTEPASQPGAEPAPAAAPSSPNDGSGSSQVVNGMLFDATVTQWADKPGPTLKKSWAELVDMLSYTLHFSVTPAPGTPCEQLPVRSQIFGRASHRQIEFQIFQGDSVFPFYWPRTSDDLGSSEPRQATLDPPPSCEFQASFILPGTGSYSVKGLIGGDQSGADEFEVKAEAVRPPMQFGALVDPGSWASAPLDAEDLDGFVSVDGTWTGELPEGWQDVYDPGVVLANLSRVELTFVDAYIEPVVTSVAQTTYNGTRHNFDLMLARARYEGKLSFSLVASYQPDEGGSLRACGAEIATYELEGLLSYFPLGEVWAAVLDLTGDLVGPHPELSEELPLKVAITATNLTDGIDPLRMYGFESNSNISNTSADVGFFLDFQDIQPNSASVITDDSACQSRLAAGSQALLASSGDGDLTGGQVTGRAVASPGSGSSVREGTAELRIDPGSEDPDFTSPIGPDGSFEFTNVPARNANNGTPALYTLSIVDASGPPQVATEGATDVLFAAATVGGVLAHTNHEVQLEAQVSTSAPTHFIAVGDRAVLLAASPVFHYSLEYWQCGGDFTPLNHAGGFTPAEVVAKCQAFGPPFEPKKLGEVELLARMGWEVWAGVGDLTGAGKSWTKQDIWVAEIMYSGTAATELMPIYTGNAADAQAKWANITGIASTYPWAEQSGFATGNIFTQWPQSMYKSLQTNSNTFVRYLVTTSGLTMVEMDGSHPGSDTPSQNTETDLARPLTFYATNTPWIGTAAKPEPSQPPP